MFGSKDYGENPCDEQIKMALILSSTNSINIYGIKQSWEVYRNIFTHLCLCYSLLFEQCIGTLLNQVGYRSIHFSEADGIFIQHLYCCYPQSFKIFKLPSVWRYLDCRNGWIDPIYKHYPSKHTRNWLAVLVKSTVCAQNSFRIVCHF